MRNFLLSLGLACGLALPAAHAQAPTWQGGAQNTNPTPSDDTGSRGLGISTDATGNAYVGGVIANGGGSGAPGVRKFGATTLTSTGNGFGNGFIAKLSTSLEWQWAVRVSNNGEGTYITHMAATPAGDVYAASVIEEISSGSILSVGSLSQAIASSHAAFVTRLNTNGQPQWIATATLSGATSASAVSISTIGWDATNGNLVVVGEYEGGSLVLGSTTLPNAPKGGVFVGRLSATGQWLSAVGAVPTVPAGSDTGFSVDAASVGTQGQVAIGFVLAEGSLTLGTTTIAATTTTGAKYGVAQLGTAGQWQWVAQPQGVTTGFDLEGLEYDRTGNLWAYGGGSTGLQIGTTTLPANTSAFVARLSSAGQWGPVGTVARQATTGTDLFVTSDLATDAQGNAVITGGLEWRTNTDSYTFGSTTLSVSNTSRNFVARFSPAGQWQYAQLTPATSLTTTDNPYGVEDMTMDGIGNLLTTGRLRRASVTFDISTLTGSQTGDAYVAKLANAGALLAVRQAAGAAPLAVYPNPAAAGAALTLRLPAATTAALPVVLRDALGRDVRQAMLPAGQADVAVSTAGLAPGLYLLEAGTSRAQVVVE
jgi:hypothetical protein